MLLLADDTLGFQRLAHLLCHGFNLGPRRRDRDRTILETLYATGIRKSELMNLTVADVNREEGILRINGGKGGKDRVVPLTRLACSFRWSISFFHQSSANSAWHFYYR